MLRNLNISLRDYMHKFPAAAITGHLSTCQNCDASTVCDSYLAADRSDPASARDFCPNMDEFDKLRAGIHDKSA
jgi:hypothetical protein